MSSYAQSIFIYGYCLSSDVSEVCINLKTNLLMPWHQEIFLRVKKCPAYSERTKNPLFMHCTFSTKGYIQCQLKGIFSTKLPTGIFSTNQRVYSVQTGIFSIKGYIQHKRVYSALKDIFSIKGYIQYQRVYSVPKGIFSIKGYIQYQLVYSVSKGIFGTNWYIQYQLV